MQQYFATALLLLTVFMQLATCAHNLEEEYRRHAQLYLKDRKIPWVIHGIDLSQGSHGLYMGLN